MGHRWLLNLLLTAANSTFYPIFDLSNNENEAIYYSISECPTMPMIDDMLIKAFAQLEAGSMSVLHSGSKNVVVSFHHHACCFS